MTNLYQITVRKSDKDDTSQFQKAFQNAFNDIYALTKLICESKNRVAQAYIRSYVYDDPPWLSFDDEQVTIIAEMQELSIHADDAKPGDDIFYDFGKRFPADDYFILAVMAIFKHHLPHSKIGKEVNYDPTGELGIAIRLVNLVNPLIGSAHANLRSLSASRSENVIELIQALSPQPSAIKSIEKSTPATTMIKHRGLTGIAAKKARKIAASDLEEDPNDKPQPRK